jgi:hypothetical protein
MRQTGAPVEAGKISGGKSGRESGQGRKYQFLRIA